MDRINNVAGSSLRGINEQTINQLNLDIYDYVEKINNTLSQIEHLVDESRSYFISDDGEDFRRRFESLSVNFPIVCQNILSYVDDLNKAKIGVTTMSQTASGSMHEATDIIMASAPGRNEGN